MKDMLKIRKMAHNICSNFLEKQSKEEKSGVKGFMDDIEKETLNNNNFRKILYTAKNSQLVLMSLKPGESIGEEVHDKEDQFFRFEAGKGKAVINGHEYEIKDDFSIVIPAGSKHDIINTGDEDLKLYTIYSPPHHKDGGIFKTKEEAQEKEEHFDGTTSEDV